MPAESAREIEKLDVIEFNSISVSNRMQSGYICTLRLCQLVYVALQQEDSALVVQRDAALAVIKAPHFVHLARAQQFTQNIDQTGTTNTFGSDISNHSQPERAIIANGNLLYRTIERGHAARNRSPSNAGPAGQEAAR